MRKKKMEKKTTFSYCIRRLN